MRRAWVRGCCKKTGLSAQFFYCIEHENIRHKNRRRGERRELRIPKKHRKNKEKEKEHG